VNSTRAVGTSLRVPSLAMACWLLLPTSLVLLPSANTAGAACSVRVCSAAELHDYNAPIFAPLGRLVANTHFAWCGATVRGAIAGQASDGLVDSFAGDSRRVEGAVGRSALLVAEDEAGALIGCCGVQALALTHDGRGERMQRELSSAQRATMRMRPLLSSLAVAPEYRRRGVATALMALGEQLVEAWGYDELLLLVGEANSAARSFYCALGYEVVGEPLEGERPAEMQLAVELLGLRSSVRWVRSMNLCLRRSLR